MTALTACTAPPRSQEWHATRATGIGASEVAAMLGLNPYKTPLQLWQEKVGKAEPFAGNYASRRGEHMEAFVLSAFADEHPGMVIETAPADIPSILRHPDAPHALASLDGLGHDKTTTSVLEVKTASYRQRAKWEDGRIPDEYAIQVQSQLAVTGLEQAYVIADVGGEYLERLVPADVDFGAYILDRIEDWWARHITGGVMPTPDVVADRDILPRLWQADPAAEPVTLPEHLVAQLRDTKAALAAARTAYEVTAAEVQALMREATTAVDGAGDTVCSWSPVKGRTTVDTARLKADGLYSAYTMTGQPGRAFRIK